MKLSNILLTATLLTACGTLSETASPQAEQTGIQLTAEQIAFNNIQIGPLDSAVVHQTIKSNGRTDIPPNFQFDINVPVAAFVEKVNVLPGSLVTRGQALAVLRHPNVSRAQADYLAEKANLEALRSDVSRKEALAASNTVAQRELEQVRSNASASEARIQTLTHILLQMDIAPTKVQAQTITDQYVLKAPISGTISQVMVQRGTLADADQPAFRLINREHEHVEVAVFQKDIGQVATGQTVKLHLPGETQTYNGQLYLIGAQQDAATLATNVHVHPGEDFPKLPVGALVFAQIQVRSEHGLVIASREIIRTSQGDFLFVKTPDGLVKSELELGLDDGEQVIIKGPEAVLHAEVVLKGNYYLNGM